LGHGGKRDPHTITGPAEADDEGLAVADGTVLELATAEADALLLGDAELGFGSAVGGLVGSAVGTLAAALTGGLGVAD
jgi:hypothetical protein